MLDERFSWVDTSKGIAIILVVIGHVVDGLIGAGIAIDGAWSTLHNIIYSFHMPLFFLMSGFFVVRSINSRSSISFALVKIDTIVYPYVLWMMIQASFLFLLGSYTNGGGADSIWDIVKIYPPGGQFWFLYHLMLMMLVTLVMYSFLRVPAVIATMASLALYFMLSNSSGDVAKFSAFYCYFLIGSLIGRNLNSFQIFLSHRFVLVVTGLGFIIVQYLLVMVLGIKHDEYGPFVLLVALVSIMFVLTFSIQISNFGFGWLRVIGQASMLIFLGHILSGSGARIVMQKLLGVNEVWIHFPVCVFAGIVPWLMIHMLSKRYPVLQYLYQIKYFSRVGR